MPIEGTCAVYLHLPSDLEFEPPGLCQRTSAYRFSFIFVVFHECIDEYVTVYVWIILDLSHAATETLAKHF